MSYTYYTIELNFGEKFCRNIIQYCWIQLASLYTRTLNRKTLNCKTLNLKISSVIPGASQPIKNPPEILQGEHYGSSTDQVQIKSYRSSHDE